LSDLQANSRQCFVCGLENPSGLHLRFYTTAPGEVTVHHTVPEQFQSYPGVVHGGIVASMLDEAAGRSFMSDPDVPRFMFTARLEVRYRHNVPVGKTITVVGRVGKDRGRTATASAAIYGPEGEVLAEAEALLVEVPKDMLETEGQDAMGWRVYDDQEMERLLRQAEENR